MGIREIIFRGKRKDNNEWVYGYYLNQTNYYGEDCNKHYIINGNEHNSYDDVCEHYEIDVSTLGEYTGVKDEKGTMIFEGDLVVCTIFGSVKPIEVRFSIDKNEIGSCGCCVDSFSGSGFIASGIDLQSCEIVGNIHEREDK